MVLTFAQVYGRNVTQYHETSSSDTILIVQGFHYNQTNILLHTL